jgi:hypothetical protein
MVKARKATAAKARKAAPVRKHNITVEVGSSIVIDPTGERLLVKAIKGGKITFEREEAAQAAQV